MGEGVVIDGSYLEGGGQIVRTAISLSALTQKPVKIINIRKKRKNKGLSHQHVACVKVVKKLCNADVDGLYVGSEELTFYPNKISPKSFKLDIGTAGSISLVIQTLLPISAVIKKPTTITVTGGTDVKNAPPIDYMKNVVLKVLGFVGVDANIEVLKRGFYPEGGGVVRLTLKPSKIKEIELVEHSRDKKVGGIAYAQNLTNDIPKRMRKSCSELLMKNSYLPNIKLENSKDTSTGAGIVLWCDTVGESCLGEKGLRSEIVGKMVAEKLLEELKSGMALDKYMGDQIIPFLAMGKGRVGISKITNHTRTNIHVVENFFDVKFKIEEYDENGCNGYTIEIYEG
ncbi:RNA 3'-terminal phosphate cyclase [Methanotorris formicicus]|uniref:RNA 3'-terminal phosphate cyclase n=1 Tax=Methanotorris formicicus Mc-S-70 TaxID=647171 RepID=H1KYP3_9EURY|nr:RNA 3'-terminal phosphate cyclase [Methanotorris formicicus]EHP86947.1 RNA 3'-phosphate cyclase [Methanotorris formicicus Mc-S-70]